MTSGTLDASRKRLVGCLLAAAAIHLVAVFAIDYRPPLPAEPLAAIDIELAALVTDATRFGTPPPAAQRETDPATTVPQDPARPDVPVDDGGESPVQEPVVAEPTVAETTAVEPAPEGEPNPLAGRSTTELAEAIADLQANRRPDVPVRRPGAATRANTEVDFYLASWGRKVERVGNINYPAEARAKGLAGTLRLAVAIASDGALKDVRVVESSGHDVLDEAALKIIRLAAPYSPFTTRMRERMEVLEFERLWQFRDDRLAPVR